MAGMGQTASQAELDRLSNRLLRSYAARCAARAELRDRKCDEDRELYEAGVFSVVPDGVLAMGRKDRLWSLWLEWNEDYGRRLLAQGTREHVERYAIEVAVHGPPGGPDVRDQEPAWRDLGGDGTLHSLALGGELRLMPLFDGGHILSFARNDSPLRVLGIGDAAELQRTALERLEQCRGDVLHVVLRGERIELRGVAAAGVLGYLELRDGARLLLGHLTGERFGLFYVRGDAGDCVGIYDFDMLRRGDLRQVLGWESPDVDEADREDEVERGHEERAASPQVNPEPRARAARPPHLAARQRPVVEPRQRARAAPEPRERPASPKYRAKLSAADQEILDLHLALTIPVRGQGMTVVPQLLVGLRGLADLGLPDQLLRGCDLRRLMKEELGIEFHCCSKTFGKALAAVAARTPLLNPVGKRWALPRIDAELLREIARLTRTARAEASTTTSSSEPAPEPPATPATSRNATAATPKSRATQPRPAATATNSPASATGSPTPPTPDPPPAVDTPTSEPDPPSQPMGEPEGRTANQLSRDAPPQPEGSQEALVDLEWLLANGHRRRSTGRRDGPLRVTLASVPDSESASRGPGRDPRGPPRWWWW